MPEANTNSTPPETDVEDRKDHLSKHRIIKNLVVVSLATLFAIGADDLAVIFQSTMNREKGVGVASVAIQSAFSFISSCFLPKYLVMKFGNKAIMVLSIILFMPFFVTNYFPMYSLMLMTSMLLGVGLSLLWGSLDPYINNLSRMYVDYQIADLLEKNKSATEQNVASIDRYTSLEPVFINFSFTDECFNLDNGFGIEAKNSIDCNVCNQNNIVDAKVGKETSTSNISNEDVISKRKDEDNTDRATYECVNLDNDFGIEAKTATDYNSSNHTKISTKLGKETRTSSISNGDVTSKQKDEIITDRTIASGIKNHDKRMILESTTVRFFSFHSMIYQTSYVLSNIASFFVLRNGYSPDRLSILGNETCSCGAAYCNLETPCSEHNLQQPSADSRNILISLCVGSCFLAFVVAIAFLDDLKRKDRNVSFSTDMLLATFRHIKKKEQLLLMPLTVNVGLMKGFYVGDFTKSYIGCAWGIQYVGLVTACAGVTMAFFSVVSGWFTKHVGRLPIFLMTAILNTGLNVILIIWQPNPNSHVMLFATAGLWGGLFGTFHTQARAFYGVLFKKDEEAAFGAYQLWYCVGVCLYLSSNDYLCNDMKIYIMITVSTLGVIGYLIVERSNSLNKNLNPSFSSKKNLYHVSESTDKIEKF